MARARDVKKAIKAHEAALRMVSGVRGFGVVDAGPGQTGEALAVYVANRTSAVSHEVPTHVEIESAGSTVVVPVRVIEVGVIRASSAA